MFNIKKRHICVVFICIALIVTFSSADEEAIAERPCNLAFRCTTNGPAAWATDGTKCLVYSNSCQLASVNCNRENNYEEKLKDISKEDCQKLCSSICTFDYVPICGEYNGVKRQFSNQCAMDSHICNTGETYSLYRSGECE